MHHDDSTHNETAQGTFGCYLPFDEAVYRHGLIPCQMLAATFSFSGLSYVSTDAGSFCVPVPRTFIRAILESGKFAWVETKRAETAFGVVGPVLRVRFAETLSDYKPVHQRLLTEAELASALSGVTPLPKPRGRKRMYHRNGVVGPSSNVASRSRSLDQGEPSDWSGQ